jgi:hypothetical protein
MHRLLPHTPYQFLDVRLAVRGDDESASFDCVNEMLRGVMADCDEIGDYAFTTKEPLTTVTTDDAPQEGDLFQRVKSYIVLAVDGNHHEQSVQVDSRVALGELEQAELKTLLEDIMVLGDDDTLYVMPVEQIERVTVL